MAKVLKTAAVIVGAVALVATGIGAAAGAGLFGAAAASGGAVIGGLTAATLTSIGALAGAASALLTLGAAALTKKPGISVAGDQTKFTANITQGIPYVIGRTQVSGWLIHRIGYDAAGTTKNGMQSFFGVWGGAGPYHALESFKIDGNALTLTGDTPSGSYNSWMTLRYKLGETPDSAAFTAGLSDTYPPGWSSTSKFSGYAGFCWTLRWDESGTTYPSGVPQPAAVLQGALVYDPRADSSYPGGSGSCRALDESTYVYSENPALHALTWALGRWRSAKRILGIGLALAAIDLPAMVQAANVADANGWKIGGVVYSTDGKWDVLKKMLAACSGEPLQLGGVLSCLVDTPRVSLATISDADIIGACTVPGGARMRDRINGVIPSCRLETHDWQIVACAKVQVDTFVAQDTRPRTKAITWELVQDADQVAELATYQICNSREIDGIVTPLKLKWIGFKPGDAVTIDSRLCGLTNQLVVLRNRSLDPSTGAVTLTSRTETSEKHGFALGKTTTPPPTPALQTVDPADLLIPGVSASWPAIADPDGTLAALRNDVTNLIADGVITRGSEKQALIRDYNALNSNWQALDAKAASLGIAASQRTAASSAMSALLAYLNSLTPAWNDTSQDTNITIATFQSRWNNATATIAALQAAIQGQPGATGATGAQGPTGPAGAAGANGASGAPGRNAVVFQQDVTPAGQVVGDTWVTVSSPKVWKKWDGSNWNPILGATAALEIIDEGYIADLAVGTIKIANASVTDGDTVANNTAFGGQGISVSASGWTEGPAGMQQIISTTVHMAYDGILEVSGTYKQNFYSGADTWAVKLQIDGNIVDSAWGDAIQDKVSLQGSAHVSAGDRLVEIFWQGGSTVDARNPRLFYEQRYK